MHLYDTLTKQIITLDKPNVKVYVCGITPYDDCHLGHGRSMIVFDILHRILREKYIVEFYQNITDIDDKIIAKAESTHQTPKELTDYYIKRWEMLNNQMNILPATYNPRVSECMQDIIDYIQVLLDKKIAYVVNGSVYFDMQAFEAKYTINTFEHLQIPTESTDHVNEKRYWKDFALWKQAKGEYISPWSAGRPGWHIECSAMLYKYCGTLVDIHGGGCDLSFPHHTNEILQSYARFEQQPATIWIHNGMICIDTIKMSKSLNNSKYLHEIITNDYTADIFRYWIMSYAHDCTMNFSEASWQQAINAFDTIRKYYFKHIYSKHINIQKITLEFNLPQLIQQIHISIQNNHVEAIKYLLDTLGFKMLPNTSLTLEYIEAQLHTRNIYRNNKQFAEADAIRTHLLQNNISIEDGINQWTYI